MTNSRADKDSNIKIVLRKEKMFTFEVKGGHHMLFLFSRRIFTSVEEILMKLHKTKIISFIIVALTLAACGTNKAHLTVPSGARAGDLLDFEGCIYEHNKVDNEAECGMIIVPENRNQPDSQLIALPVIRVITLEDHPGDPRFWFAGGPGNSNMGLPGVLGLIDNHDLVMVGNRDRDGSVVMDYPEMAKSITGIGGNLLSKVYSTLWNGHYPMRRAVKNGMC